MATTGTSALSAEVKALYDADYNIAGQSQLYFDQMTDTREIAGARKGSSYEFPILTSLPPSATPLDELADVVPQQMSALVSNTTVQEYGAAVSVTRFVNATSYADVYQQAAYLNGYNMAESFDLIVRTVAGQGSRFHRQNGRATRSLFDGTATAADRCTAAFIERLGMLGRAYAMPLWEDNHLAIIMHPFVMYDLQQQSDIRTMSNQGGVTEMLLNGELAKWHGVRFLVSKGAKGFWGSGAARASALSATLSAPVIPGATNIKVSSVTNAAVGQWIAIRDAEETGNTWSDTNELFMVTAVGTAGAAGTGIDGYPLDPGPLGGLRYAHSVGTVVNNNNSAYPLCVMGPKSITKVASEETGEFGSTVVSGPVDYLGRFVACGWYHIGGWSRTWDPWLFRGECGASES